MGELADRTIKNTAYSFAGFIWNLLLSFVSAPIIINGLGTAKYGLFILLNTIMTVFSLLDLGISYTFFKKLSENPDNPEYHKLSKLFSTTFWFYCFVGVFTITVLLVGRGFFNRIVNPKENLVFSYDLLFLMVGLSFLFRVSSVAFQQIPIALQRLDLVTKIGLLNSTLIQLFSILVVWQGKGVTSLVAIQLFCSVLILLIYVLLWKKMLPKLKIKLYFSFNHFWLILKDGVLVFFANILNNVIAQFDKFVLSFFWGPSAVTYYSSSQMVTDKIHTTALSLSNSFSPVFSNVSHLQQNDRLVNIFRRSVRVIMFVTFGLMVVIACYGWEFMHYWLGGDFAQKATPAIYFLAVTYFFLSIFAFLYAFLIGIKRLKFLVFAAGLIAFLDIVFMFILIPKFSVTGAAIAYLISVLPVFGYLYFIENHIFGIKNKLSILKYYISSLIKMSLTGVLVFLLAELVLNKLIVNLWTVLLIGGFTYILYACLYKLFGFFDKEDWNLLSNFFKKVLNKFLK